jgi:hypothetical protein
MNELKKLEEIEFYEDNWDLDFIESIEDDFMRGYVFGAYTEIEEQVKRDGFDVVLSQEELFEARKTSFERIITRFYAE